MNAMRLPAHSAVAFCLLFLLAGTCSAQGLTQKIYKSPSGESVQFLGDSVSLKYFPAASANCSQCFLSFKLGALSELDAFGQPVAAHTVPDLSNLVPEVTGGQRMSGSVSYQYVTMTFTPERLPAALNKNNCPSLESIINQAYSAGVGPHDNDLIARFSDDAAAQHRHAPVHLVGQAAPELAQMSPFGRRLQQLGRWLPRIQLTPMPSPSAQSPPPPSPAAPTPWPETKPAEPSSDKPAAGDSKAAADKPAEQQQSSDKVDIVSTRKPADEQQPEQKQEPKQEEPKQEQKQEETKREEPKQEKPEEPKQEEPKQEEPKQEQQEEPKQQQAPAEAPPSSPPSEQVAAPVAIQPPTTDQLLGPHKKADEPAADKPAPQEAPKPAAPAAADKPAEAAAPKPAAPAADAPKAPADKAPAPTHEPAKEKQPQAAPGTIPIPAEKDENEGADSSSEEKPAEPPAPAAAASPAPAAVPGVLGPSVPATQAADLWRQQQEQQQAADSIHQQLAAHGGYLVPTPPAAPAGQAWGAYPGANTLPGGGFPAGGGDFGDAPPQFRVTFMFGFSHNKTFAYGRGRVVSAPAGSIKYTVEAQNWPFCSLYNSLKLEVVMASTVKEAQPQFVLSDAADVFEDMDSMRGPATRKLHQSVPMGNSEAFTDWMDTDKIVGKKAAVGMGGLGAGGLDMLGMSSGPVKSVSTAKLLVGPNLAAATDFPTYAFSSDRFTSESNVSVVLATSRDAARFSLTFRYFEQGLFYDPTMFFTHKDDMMVAGADVLPSVPTASLCKNETECVRGRRRVVVQGNGSSMPGAALCLRSLASAAAVLLAMLLL